VPGWTRDGSTPSAGLKWTATRPEIGIKAVTGTHRPPEATIVTPDLSDFGGGVEAAETDDAPTDQDGGFGDDQTYNYRHGRCRAITTDGARCKSPKGFREPLCHTHQMQHDAVTINDEPIELIEAKTRTIWRNFENERVRAAVRDVSGSGDTDA